MVLTAPEYARPGRIPFVRVVRRPGVFHRFPNVRPILAQPGNVSKVLPLPIGFDDGAEMAIRTGTDDVEAGAERKSLAKGQATVWQLIVGELGFPERPLQSWKKISQCLLIIPDVGTTPLARTFAGMLTFPPPDFAPFQTNKGRGAEDAKGTVDRVDDFGRQRRFEDRITEGQGLRLKHLPTLESVRSAGRRISPLGCVVVLPGWR